MVKDFLQTVIFKVYCCRDTFETNISLVFEQKACNDKSLVFWRCPTTAESLTGATVCVWEITVSSRPSFADLTLDSSVQVNWKPSTAAGCSACWESLHRSVSSRVPLTCSKSADSRSGRSMTFLPDRGRSDTKEKANEILGAWGRQVEKLQFYYFKEGGVELKHIVGQNLRRGQSNSYTFLYRCNKFWST